MTRSKYCRACPLRLDMVSRLVVRTRRGAAVLAVALGTLWIASCWYWVGWFDTDGVTMVTLRVADGHIAVTWGPDPVPGMPGRGRYFESGSLDGECSTVFNGHAPRSILSLPLWPVVLGIASASSIGLLIPRLTSTSASGCKACGYLLAGLSRCPECGRVVN